MGLLHTDSIQFHIDQELFPGMEHLAPGVIGYTVEQDGALYIPLLYAERPGNGDVGKYLDGLPRDRTIKVPNVINSRLRGMLLRRGFLPVMEWAEDFEEEVEVFVRRVEDTIEERRDTRQCK